MQKFNLLFLFSVIFLTRVFPQNSYYTIDDSTRQLCNDLPYKHRLKLAVLLFPPVQGIDASAVDSVRVMLIDKLQQINCFDVSDYKYHFDMPLAINKFDPQVGVTAKVSVNEIKPKAFSFKLPKIAIDLTAYIIDLKTLQTIYSQNFSFEGKEQATEGRFFNYNSKENAPVRMKLLRSSTLESLRFILSKKDELFAAHPIEGYDEYTPLNKEAPTGLRDQSHLPIEAEYEFEEASTLVSNSKFEEALPHYLKSAQLGNSDAALEIGIYLNEGTFIKRDIEESAKWLKFAAINGNNYAFFTLAGLKNEGSNKESQISTLAQDSIAAEKGVSDAAINLAYLYKAGSGKLQHRYNLLQIIPSAERSAYWYKKAFMILTAASRVLKDTTLLHKMGELVNTSFNDINKVAIIAQSINNPDVTYKPEDYKVETFIVTKFNGNFLSTGYINTAQPFEIECKAALGFGYYRHFKVNFRNINGVLSYNIMTINLFLEAELATSQASMPVDSGIELGFRDLR